MTSAPTTNAPAINEADGAGPPDARRCVVIYARVSTREQGESGLGLEGQEADCRAEAERRNWRVVEVIRETISGDKAKRPGFDRACHLARTHGCVLLAAKADRVTRAGVKFVLELYERAAREGWAVYALDVPEFDTTSAMGEFVLTQIAAVNRLERRMAGERNKAAMLAKIARGEPVGRPKLGEGKTDTPADRERASTTIARLKALRAAGLSYEKVAQALNAEGTLGLRGGRWHKRSSFLACKRYGIS